MRRPIFAKTADRLEADIAEFVPRRATLPQPEYPRPPTPVDLHRFDLDEPAPVEPVVIEPRLPDYVVPRADVPRVGLLTSTAVVKDFEATALGIKELGGVLEALVVKCEEISQGAKAALVEIDEVVARCRDSAKQRFVELENAALLTQDVRDTCSALTKRILGE